MSVRPPPSMSTVSVRRSTGRGVVEIFSILFPRTRRCDGGERVPLFPSKIRTFWNKVTGSDAGFCAAKGSDQKSARAMSVRLVFVFIGAVFSCTLAGTDSVFTRIAMRSDHCSKALYRELKNESTVTRTRVVRGRQERRI